MASLYLLFLGASGSILSYIHQLRQKTVVLSNFQIPLLPFELQRYMIFICINLQKLNYFFLLLFLLLFRESQFMQFILDGLPAHLVCQTCFFPCFPVGSLNRFLQQFYFSVFCQPLMAFYPQDPLQQIHAFFGLFIPGQCLFKTNGLETGYPLFIICPHRLPGLFPFAMAWSIWSQSSNVSFMRSSPRAMISIRIP